MKLSEALGGIGRPVAYYPRIAQALGSVKSAILCAQLVYWWDRQNRGFVFKNSDEIEEETGLSYKEQRAARSRLRELGILEDHYNRLKHRLEFRINFDALDAVWDRFRGASSQKEDRELTKGQIAS
jgi:hypothetical protein